MKKILIAIAMVSAIITNAQVTDTGDNVGIGTSNPSQKLDVNGNTRTNNLQLNGGDIKLSIPNTTGGWARGILYYNPNTYSTNEIGGIGMFGSGSTQTRMFMGFGDDPWNSTKGIQIKSNGYVGIGTTAPNSILDIKSQTDKVALRLSMPTNEDAAAYEIKWDNTNNNVIHRVQYSNNYYNVIDINRVNRNISFTGGNVGIGTSTPSQKLDVNGHITLNHTSSDYTNIQIGHDINDRIYVDNTTPKHYGGGMFFRVTTDPSLNIPNNYIDLLMLTDKGNVGISTKTPSEKLDVNGNIASTGTISLGKVASTSSLRDVISLYGDRLGATNMYGFGVESDGTLYNKATNHYRWYLNSNADLGSSAKMELDDTRLFVDGNVGIGTSNPSHNMDISNNSTLRNVGVELDASHYTGTGTSHSYIQFRTPNYKTDNVLTNGAAEIGLSNANGNLYITRKTNVGSNSHGIVLDQNANVGIGTTNIPSQFKLAVAGKMITEEVTVKLQSAWPDYVFTNHYKLPTLKEVEKQIKENGHLANIPSAEEVSENGIELGEMNKKLLEKVEELTLYTIQQEKAIEKQNDKINKQEKELKELKALVQKLLTINKNK